ncbi:hypothetical protein NHQ30_001324 [Ciborinia camelliae]|nr:hypothetical protein NHQ30_001324 [Ciborinia camelliae]
MNWLDPEKLRVSQYKEHTRHRDERAGDTGEDFLHGQFQDWLFSDKKLLWLRGEVAFYYCSFSDNSTFDVVNFQKSVIAQICEKCNLFPELKELYENWKPYPAPTNQLTTLLLSIIRSITGSSIQSAVSSHAEVIKSITLIIDGLDEVPPGKPRDGFLKVIGELKSIEHQRFRVIVVSREEGDIKSSFPKDDGWQWLMRDTVHITLDIEQFVQARITNHRRLNSQSSEIKNLISERLSQGSKGMFRLAALQMKELEYLTRNLRVVQKADLENIFATLPRDLDTFYDLIISRIPRGLLSELETVLKWLVFAARPLFVEEIVEVCTVQQLSSNALPSIGSRRHALDILESLPGLVKLEPPLADDLEIVPHGVHILSICHFSVQEYLCPTHDIDRPSGLFRFTDIYKEHQIIAKTCLAYLLHCFKSENGRTVIFPLRAYCWYSWSMHITATTDSYSLKAKTTPASLRLHNSIANPIIYRKSPEVISNETARFRSFAAMLSPETYIELLTAIENLEFPFSAYDSSERGLTSHQIPYQPIVGNCPDATRFVILYPSNEPDSPLNCGICVDSLDNNPDYVALSYAWGAQSPMEWNVHVNGFILYIRPNLHSAIAHLRHKTELRILWIDAICIDMADYGERSFQIRLMARLFSQAEEVIMWLGESEDRSEASEAKAMDILNKETPFHEDPTSYYAAWQYPVDRLFKRGLWRRAWTIQESVFAAKLTVMCGQHYSSFDNWHNIREMRRHKQSLERRFVRLVSSHSLEADEAAWDAVITVQTIREQYRKNGRMELELATLLFLSRRHESSDYRDKLYALLSLLGDKERSDPLLHPDYSLSVAEMARKLTVYVLKKYQNLTTLASAFGTSNTNFSSWILDLYALRRPIIIDDTDTTLQNISQNPRKASETYNAGGKYVLGDHPFSFSSDLKLLKVWGVIIDSVTSCKPELGLHRNIHWGSSRDEVRAFRCLEHGLCFGPTHVRDGDLVVVLFGSIVPFLLRKTRVNYVQIEPGKGYNLVGECYVEGIMSGEIVTEYQAGRRQGQEFWLV